MKALHNASISVIIPAKNEAATLQTLLPELKNRYPDFEIIVVNDGSTDHTADIARSHHVTVVSHLYPMGHGAAIKSGVRHANGDILLFMDGDGQHQVSDIPALLSTFEAGYDMVVGERNIRSQASLIRWAGNTVYNTLASHIVGHRIGDLTSGFRIVRAKKFKDFLFLLPNGFSSPTTITMAFFRCGYSVAYVPIHIKKRIGKSHLLPLRDGLRFLIIIYKMTALYSPLKVFLPFAALHFFIGIVSFFYTLLTQGCSTHIAIFMLSASVIIFFIGLLGEQLTALLYSTQHHENT